MRSSLTIAVQCHHFQRRFCWMLSSLAQQTRRAVTVDVAFMAGNGKPSTEEVCALFEGGLALRKSVWTDYERFQYRGLVRNQQIQECDTEWLMFGDCDMVYHLEYFERLLALLEKEHSGAPYMLSSGRTSNPLDLTNQTVNLEVQDAPRMVEAAFRKADALPKIRKCNVGAGFCQLINMRHAPHEGYYVAPESNRDWNWGRGSNPRSDMQFRRRIARDGNHRRNLPGWFSENAIHLNHNRDPDAGRHIEEQR
jgi:hypothetical protein